jgi:DNA-binding transcriptional MerR regulator
MTQDTLRAWERRYQAVTPNRGERGRVYDESHIRRLQLLRDAVERGHSIGQVATLTDTQLKELQSQVGTAPAPAVDYGVFGEAVKPLFEAVQAYDYNATNDELGRLALLLRPSDLIYHVVLPLMKLAGQRWEEGTFQVAHEHLLSACVRNLLGGLVRRQETQRSAPWILLTTPQGELHEFGILSAALLAVTHHWQVSYLGTSLPATEILFAANNIAPRAVVLGIMEVNATTLVHEEIVRIAQGLPKSTELWIGGSGRKSAVGEATSENIVTIEDLAAFERHLDRLSDTR